MGTIEPYGATFAAFYDRFFGDYAEKASPVLLKYISREFPGEPPRILDLGCGTGRLAYHLAEAGCPVTGLDLSPDMLALAERRCARPMASGRARFLREDIADFRVEGPFDLALSTYNSMNHLDSEAKLRGCFRSVRACLADGGRFLFDYHTAKGLGEWIYSEASKWEEGEIRATGTFDAAFGTASMRLVGKYRDLVIDETLTNRTFPLGRIGEWLREEGFQKVVLSEMTALGAALAEPEAQKRVVILAS